MAFDLAVTMYIQNFKGDDFTAHLTGQGNVSWITKSINMKYSLMHLIFRQTFQKSH